MENDGTNRRKWTHYVDEAAPFIRELSVTGGQIFNSEKLYD
jgi:hypothetical protein